MTTTLSLAAGVLPELERLSAGHYIDGQWTPSESDARIDVYSPATEEIVGSIPAGTAGDADRAVTAARRAFAEWSATPREKRLGYLKAITEALNERREELAQVMSLEIGSPIQLSRNMQALLPSVTFQVATELLTDYEFEYQLNGVNIVREPIGVVGGIVPWNFPLHQVALKVAPAIASGCTIVIKSTEVAPLSAVLFADILDKAGLPRGVFNLVHGTGLEVGEAIASHPEVDMVSFTGSTRAGRRVSELASATIKKVALELGGKSANVILDGADLEKAVTAGILDCYTNAGQACNAQTRMLVPRALLGQAEEIAAKVAGGQVVGDPADENTTVGPVVSATQRDRVRQLINQGVREGARLVAGGAEQPAGLDTGFYVRPTVFSDVKHDMTIAREEIFGPVLSILPYDTVEEAVHIANDTVYGLSGAVWGPQDEAVEVAKQIRSGQVFVNGADYNFHAPFGGYKQSGNGREWGVFGLEEYLEVKALLV
ncbi:aldehyde dehydrogenase family protein [Gordonia sp. zg691]|uniref:aldehyde dehydrogenase (NAD(+)) n=1 Tax=Gordonia jinghuaiqii TaxID=2758710 RepID=A0A7D7LYE1_9ACTN|nr:aldehyde dehydrogenase family protein [Gordonia jinghuaiqii]MBD0862926.1 aldehyde dehydrogenase family protein [Gordonia jinghuaiqii]MCR5978949.1 aldehyde dehydrogenase family protein [Gordonia jinghuaiqii]QMT01714.1 aldehyde dehydrogenase family protein [Gordonia jinghuaiqii]